MAARCTPYLALKKYTHCSNFVGITWADVCVITCQCFETKEAAHIIWKSMRSQNGITANSYLGSTMDGNELSDLTEK